VLDSSARDLSLSEPDFQNKPTVLALEASDKASIRQKNLREETMKRSTFLAGLVFTAFAGATAVAQEKDIVDTAVAAGSFTTLVKAVEAAGLVDTLKGEGPFTVFAPTDEAFAKLPPGTLDKLLGDPGKLKAVLTYHVVAGKVMSGDVKPGMVRTVEGSSAKVKVKGGKVMIDNANVVKTDIECSNGVIHVIDSVILPKK
jgi:uncharacterized surface protein with fasciclin (FAS1) repeats